MFDELSTRPRLAITLVGSLLMAFSIVSLVLHVIYNLWVVVAPINDMLNVIITLGWVYIDLLLHRNYKKWGQKAVVRTVVYQILLTWIIGGLAVQIVTLTYKRSSHTFITTVDAFSIVANAIYAILYCHISWWPDPRIPRTMLMMCAIIEFIIGTIGVTLSGRNRLEKFFAEVSALITGLALFGIAICLAMRESDRLDPVLTRFIRLYHVMTGILMVLEIVFLGTAINAARNVFTCLASSVLALSVAHTVVACRLQKRPPSHLKVEIVDLNQLSDSQCDAYADLIDRHGRSYAGAPSGKHAISLMKAYCAASNSQMSCLVLRVYKDSTSNKAIRLPFSKAPLPTTYEEMVAWRDLDKEDLLPQIVAEVQKGKPVSKGKLKRLQKKNASAVNALAAKLEEAEFDIKLRDTEALVLLTRIENYDLTSSIHGFLGKLFRRVLGSESRFKPLVVRMGMLAFHWPFRQSTFYTHSTKRPVARSAAVSRAIQEWNKSTKNNCVLILDPRYKNDRAERAIAPSGWNSVPLPASHIVDLRPYKGKSIAEYLKAIKYRNKTNFTGEVIESTDFTPGECEEVMRLWRKIADKRTAEGHHAVLAEPNSQMISTLNSGDGYRSLLFLKVDGHVIASCVLFRLGDTLTSDLQGLDHEEARKHKAYFVMMQHTIGIALREGISFVDFGPTTAKPKLDIGCTSVPLMGGITATNPLLNFSIKYAAQSVTINND